MQEKIRLFMRDIGFYPVDNKNWNYFTIRHCKPEFDISEKKIFDLIRKEVGNKSGIYLYKNEKDEILYIGKGNPLFNRIKSHYIESYKPVSGDRSGRFHNFFSENQGDLVVYWKELENELYRQIVETMLKTEYTPKFFA